MRGVVGKIVDKYTGNFKIEKKPWKTTYLVEVERKQEGWIPKPLCRDVPWGEDGKVWWEWREVAGKVIEDLIRKASRNEG